ncbi:hypothetical protein E4U42_001351 [Claviceps africana]|uniref:Uncharacterized protein n=1 Tax=Claviceps africana TaxID=83212 RepID=A0A8K0JDC4_9HYPO|nr:hypothetical protein E4U42_001351 [Claviceps africana]
MSPVPKAGAMGWDGLVSTSSAAPRETMNGPVNSGNRNGTTLIDAPIRRLPSRQMVSRWE